MRVEPGHDRTRQRRLGAGAFRYGSSGGHSVADITHRHFREDAFDPCRNLAASARVLSSNYLSVAQSSPTTEAAIATAMSMYNTGSRSRGFGNGYVSRVYASASIVVPAIRNGLIEAAGASTARAPVAVPPAAAAVRAPDIQTQWDTTAGAQAAQLIVFGATSSRLQKGQTE